MILINGVMRWWPIAGRLPSPNPQPSSTGVESE